MQPKWMDLSDIFAFMKDIPSTWNSEPQNIPSLTFSPSPWGIALFFERSLYTNVLPEQYQIQEEREVIAPLEERLTWCVNQQLVKASNLSYLQAIAARHGINENDLSSLEKIVPLMHERALRKAIYASSSYCEELKTREQKTQQLLEILSKEYTQVAKRLAKNTTDVGIYLQKGMDTYAKWLKVAYKT